MAPAAGQGRGSVPEVVEDGITGLIADDPIELVASARIAETFFDRERIRQIARKRWNADRMAEDGPTYFNGR